MKIEHLVIEVHNYVYAVFRVEELSNGKARITSATIDGFNDLSGYNGLALESINARKASTDFKWIDSSKYTNWTDVENTTEKSIYEDELKKLKESFKDFNIIIGKSINDLREKIKVETDKYIKDTMSSFDSKTVEVPEKMLNWLIEEVKNYATDDDIGDIRNLKILEKIREKLNIK